MSKEVTISGIFKDFISGPSGKAANNLSRNFKGAQKSTKGLSLGFASMAGAMGGISATITSKLLSSLAKLPGAMLKASTSVEDLTLQFTTLLGSTEAAQDRMEELVKFAADTPFDLPELATASRVLETLTQGALSSGEGLRMVGDSAAASGSEFENLAMHIGRAYGGLMSNRAIGESMSRLQELGAVAPEVRNQIEALQKASKGKEAWEVLRAELDKSKGAMELMSKSTNGIIRNIKDNFDAAFRDILGGSMDGFKKALTFIKDVLDKLKENGAFKGLGEAVKTAFDIITDGAPTVEEAVDGITDTLKVLSLITVSAVASMKTAWSGLSLVVNQAGYGIATTSLDIITTWQQVVAFTGGLKKDADIDVEYAIQQYRKIYFDKSKSKEWAQYYQDAVEKIQAANKDLYASNRHVFTTDTLWSRSYADADKEAFNEVAKMNPQWRKAWEERENIYTAYYKAAQALDESPNSWSDGKSFWGSHIDKPLADIKKFRDEQLEAIRVAREADVYKVEASVQHTIDELVALYANIDKMFSPKTPKKTAVPGLPTPEETQKTIVDFQKLLDAMDLRIKAELEVVGGHEAAISFLDEQMAAVKSVQEIYIEGMGTAHDKARAQTEASLNENIQAIRQSVYDRFLTEQEGEDAITQLRQNAADKRTEIAKDEARERQEIQQDTFDAVISGIASVNGAISQVFQHQQQMEDERTARQIENVKQNVRGKRAQEAAIQKIEENAEKERKKIRKRELLLSWATAIANTAEGVSKAIAQGGVAGIITGAAVAAVGTIQTGIILSQISKLAKGGIVGGQGQSDTEPALLTPGEMVLNRGQQSRLFAIANGASAPGGAGSNIIFNESIVVHGNLDSAAAEQIRVDREKQLMGLKSMMQELSYRGQLSSAVFA